MPQQGLPRAEGGSPRSIEQTHCDATQPVPIKALQPQPYGSRSELPIEQIPTENAALATEKKISTAPLRIAVRRYVRFAGDGCFDSHLKFALHVRYFFIKLLINIRLS
jgi:hypothetical protein